MLTKKQDSTEISDISKAIILSKTGNIGDPEHKELCDWYLDKLSKVAGVFYHRKIKGYDSHINNNITVDDLIADLYCHLANKKNSDKYVCSVNHLHRELGKCYMNKYFPWDKRVYKTTKQALRHLIKKGLVKKLDTQNTINNDTSFSLINPQNDFHKIPLSGVLESISKRDCYVTQKTAEDFIYDLLTKFNYPLKLRDILSSLKNKFKVRKECLVNDKTQSEEPNIDFEKEEDINTDREQLRAFDIRIVIEAENKSEAIWNKAKNETGKIPGTKYLCCYFIPKFIYEKNVRLEDFGSSSTVEYTAAKIDSFIKDEFKTTDLNNQTKIRIMEYMFKILTHKCSEIGHCCTL